MNWVKPSLHMVLKRTGLASLKPVTINTPASAESGIRFRTPGKNPTKTSSKKPWKIADRFVVARMLTFTELRTMTEVMGSPPIRPEQMLPTP